MPRLLSRRKRGNANDDDDDDTESCDGALQSISQLGKSVEPWAVPLEGSRTATKAQLSPTPDWS